MGAMGTEGTKTFTARVSPAAAAQNTAIKAQRPPTWGQALGSKLTSFKGKNQESHPALRSFVDPLNHYLVALSTQVAYLLRTQACAAAVAAAAATVAAGSFVAAQRMTCERMCMPQVSRTAHGTWHTAHVYAQP